MLYRIRIAEIADIDAIIELYQKVSYIICHSILNNISLF